MQKQRLTVWRSPKGSSIHPSIHPPETSSRLILQRCTQPLGWIARLLCVRVLLLLPLRVPAKACSASTPTTHPHHVPCRLLPSAPGTPHSRAPLQPTHIGCSMQLRPLAYQRQLVLGQMSPVQPNTGHSGRRQKRLSAAGHGSPPPSLLLGISHPPLLSCPSGHAGHLGPPLVLP